jgi:transcription antitermination factor NusG
VTDDQRVKDTRQAVADMQAATVRFEAGDAVDIIAGPYEGLAGTIDHTHAADYPNQCVTVRGGKKLHIYNQNLRRTT